jgi:hypothetical protein
MNKFSLIPGSLVGAALLVGGCFEPGTFVAEEDQARVAPLDLVMDNRVVLTPGHRVLLEVQIVREQPDPTHPVTLDLDLTGLGGNGVSATLDTQLTKADVAVIAIEASASAPAQELHYTLDGKLGLYVDQEPLTISVQHATPVSAGGSFGGEESYAPGVSGVTKTLTVNGQQLTYEVINGLAIVGGDIVMGDAATLETRLRVRSATCNPSFHTDFSCSAWTNGVIGYSFADNWGDAAENARMRGIITAAMAEWTRQTGIGFVPRTSGEHLQFRDGHGCSSELGRAIITGFDSQSISLNNTGCDDVGIAMHEIGHAIGLWHEQTRNDRDGHVVVNFGAIQWDQIGNFMQFGEFVVDRGPYNYESIMHYRWNAFANNKEACDTGRAQTPPDFSACSVYPIAPRDAVIGQRDHLSEGDLHGAYRLYPPVFNIVGALPGQSSDRFTLWLDYDRGRPQVDRVQWTVDGATPLGTGNRITIRRGDLATPGTHVITARFVVDGFTIASRSITLDFSNAAPTLSLAATNGSSQQQMNQVFSVFVTASDVEDPTCADCRFHWMPLPTVGPTDGRLASFSFSDPGPHTIAVAVEDRGGAITTASLTLDIVNSPPTVRIVRPTDGIVVQPGTYLFLSGSGSDPNTGALRCDQLHWSSSETTDVWLSTTGCSPTLRVMGAGPRTLTLVGTDGDLTATDTVDFTVTSCTTAGCPPTAYFELSDPDLSSGVYFIESTMSIAIRLGDSEQNEPITYRVYGRRVGQTTTFPISTGSEMLLDETTLAVSVDLWRPYSAVDGGWNLCTTDYRDYEIVLDATDSSGMTTTFSRVVPLGCNFF